MLILMTLAAELDGVRIRQQPAGIIAVRGVTVGALSRCGMLKLRAFDDASHAWMAGTAEIALWTFEKGRLSRSMRIVAGDAVPPGCRRVLRRGRVRSAAHGNVAGPAELANGTPERGGRISLEGMTGSA